MATPSKRFQDCAAQAEPYATAMRAEFRISGKPDTLAKTAMRRRAMELLRQIETAITRMEKRRAGLSSPAEWEKLEHDWVRLRLRAGRILHVLEHDEHLSLDDHLAHAECHAHEHDGLHGEHELHTALEELGVHVRTVEHREKEWGGNAVGQGHGLCFGGVTTSMGNMMDIACLMVLGSFSAAHTRA